MCDSRSGDPCSRVCNRDSPEIGDRCLEVDPLGDDGIARGDRKVVGLILFAHRKPGLPLALPTYIKARVESYGYRSTLRVMQIYVNA